MEDTDVKTKKPKPAQALTTKRLAKLLKTPGRYRDNGGVRGLYLQVRKTQKHRRIVKGVRKKDVKTKEL